jgi:ribosomal protein S9
VFGQQVHVSTNQATLVEMLESGSAVLEMHTPFDTDNTASLLNISTTIVDSGGLTMGNLSGIRHVSASGIVNINNGALLVTQDHAQIIKRSGSWIARRAEEVLVGDYLLGIDGEEVEITSVILDDVNPYEVVKVDTEPMDVFWVNGLLTHNFKLVTFDGGGGGGFGIDP